MNCCNTPVLALLSEWCLFLCPGGAQHSHPGITVDLTRGWCTADDDCNMLVELLLSAKRVNISISATDYTVQTPMRYTCIYVFTNPTKPLRNSSIGFEVTLSVGTVPLLLPFFLHYPNLLRHQNVPWELYLKLRAAESCWTPCSSFTFWTHRTTPALQASTFLTHLLRLLIPRAAALLYEVLSLREERKGMCGLLLVPSPSSCRRRKPRQTPESTGRRHRCIKGIWYRSRT